MKRKAAALLVGATVFLCIPTMASSSPFYGTTPGAAKKACADSGGVWNPSLQTCTT
jgi:hypothetical protein